LGDRQQSEDRQPRCGGLPDQSTSSIGGTFWMCYLPLCREISPKIMQEKGGYATHSGWCNIRHRNITEGRNPGQGRQAAGTGRKAKIKWSPRSSKADSTVRKAKIKWSPKSSKADGTGRKAKIKWSPRSSRQKGRNLNMM
jgi:hypothetical protein